MVGQRLVNSLDRYLKVILQVAFLNFLWILFTLMGLIIGGIFPATTAAINVARKWHKEKEMHGTFKVFKETYKKEFIKSNMIGLILTLIGGVLLLNYYALQVLGNKVSVFVVFAYFFVTFLYCVLAVWIFPLLSHYDTTIIQYFKNALIIGITKIKTTVIIMSTTFIVMYFSLKLPSMLLFYSVSLIVLSCSFFAEQVFAEIDESVTNQ